MSGGALLFLWCASGGLVGWAIGARTDHSLVGLILGSFMGVFGWVLILGASPRAGSPSPLASSSTVQSSGFNEVPAVHVEVPAVHLDAAAGIAVEAA